MSDYYNRNIIITDQDNVIVCRGRCVSQKYHPFHLVSIDNKLFFRTDRFSVRYDYFNINDQSFTRITDCIKVVQFRDIQVDQDGDLYVENDETELDKEIEPLVHALNRIHGIKTTGSCSGHGGRKPWVIIEFSDLNALSSLIRIIHIDMFKDMFTLTSDGDICLIEGALPSLKLECNKFIPESEKDLNRLAVYIQEIYG